MQQEVADVVIKAGDGILRGNTAACKLWEHAKEVLQQADTSPGVDWWDKTEQLLDEVEAEDAGGILVDLTRVRTV